MPARSAARSTHGPAGPADAVRERRARGAGHRAARRPARHRRGAPGELRVVLEITERALGARPAELLRTVERVRALGWGVALDDVGAETMSLAFMPLLRPDVVKLDLRLVQERPGPAIAEIMNAVNAYAEQTGAVVLAEGIETEAHLAMARALGATPRAGLAVRPARPRAGPGPRRRRARAAAAGAADGPPTARRSTACPTTGRCAGRPRRCSSS